MAGEVHIIVGCGGSGILTLARLNELLSQDYYWRQRLDNDIYYVIVDTDVDEMQQFEKSVLRDLAGVPDKPHITPIQLSKGETHLQPLINQHFVDPFTGGRNEEGRQRLLEHWWNRGPDAPFVAPNVTAVTRGAGQCPPISYFLTWKNLERLETEFHALIDAIQRRRGGFGRYDELNFVIVAGLAGGTGRGTWELIAFKLRELFGRHGTSPTPRAFLFDSSVFRDVFDQHPEQRMPMRVNSLTGVSQLSCWISNKQEGHENPKAQFAYRLPSMTSPQNPAADALQVDLKLDVNNGAPVNHAYLVFAQNGVSQLADHYQYCEMVGAGIYAALSKSSILRQAINSGFPYVGLATATYEVNAATIRRYFEAQARVQAVRRLAQVSEVRVDEQVSDFFRSTHLRIDVTDDDPTSQFHADPRGLLLQRVLARLDAKSSNRLAALSAALDADHVEDVKRLVRGALTSSEDLVRASLQETLRDDQIDPLARVETLTKELFEDSRSAADVKLFIEKVQAGLAEEIEEMPAEMPWGREDPIKMVDEFARRPLPLIYPHFNEAERKKLLEVTRRGIAKANYAAIRTELEEAYRQWSRDIDRLRANADDLMRSLQKLEQRFSHERERTVPEHDNAFEHLFTDPARPEKGLDERFSARKFYRRELKPVLERGHDTQLLNARTAIEKELFVTVHGALAAPRDFSEADAFEQRKRLESRLEQAVRDTVGLPDAFMTDHFSIRKVVSGLVRAWKQRLRRSMSSDERHHLEERFQEFFGFVPARRQDDGDLEYDFPEIEEFILEMAASLARTCKPYWMLHRDRGKDFRVALFVPTAWDRERAKTYVVQRLQGSFITPEVHPQLEAPSPSGGATANPFILLAYSTEGVSEINDVESLKYYAESEVFDLIRATEDPSGRTIFEGAINGGIGYVDPLYVRNETIRQFRWRPWALGDTTDVVEEQRTLDALLYALFPGEGQISPTLEQVKSRLDLLGWTMPLVANKGRNRYVFTRLPLEYVNGRVRIDHQTQDLAGWDRDLPVAPTAGLHHVYQALHGGGQGHNPAWRQRILHETETFWSTIMLGQLSMARGTPAFREIMYAYGEWLGTKSRAGKADDPNNQVWSKLLTRAKELANA